MITFSSFFMGLIFNDKSDVKLIIHERLFLSQLPRPTGCIWVRLRGCSAALPVHWYDRGQGWLHYWWRSGKVDCEVRWRSRRSSYLHQLLREDGGGGGQPRVEGQGVPQQLGPREAAADGHHCPEPWRVLEPHRGWRQIGRN